MVKIKANGNEIALLTSDTDYISLTDIAKYKSSENPADIIKNWLRNRNTLEFLGAWEKMNNLNFKLVEFDQFKSEAGLNSFLMSPKKWIQTTNAVGLSQQQVDMEELTRTRILRLNLLLGFLQSLNYILFKIIKD